MDKQMEGGWFSFKFVSSLNIRCDKVNAPKSKSCTKSPNWLRYKNTTINQKNVRLHNTIKRSKIILSGYQKLNHFLIY